MKKFKKFTSIAALALLSAAPFSASAESAPTMRIPIKAQQEPQKASSLERHEFNCIDDVVGTYKWNGKTHITGDTDPNKKITISKVEGSNSKVEISGMLSDYKFIADVEFEEGSLSIPEQVIGTTDSGAEVVFTPATWTPTFDSVKELTFPAAGYFRTSIGTIYFDIYQIFQVKADDKYLMLTDENTFYYLSGDYEIRCEVPECVSAKTLDVDIKAGDDAKVIKAAVRSGIWSPTEDVLADIAANATEIHSGINNFDLSGTSRGSNTLLLVSIDADNNIRYGATYVFMLLDDEEDQWKSIGEGTMTDDIIASRYAFSNAEYSVRIQENKNQPGYYRIVNPYTENYTYARHNKHVCDHNHYLYIHAENPDKVTIAESASGFASDKGLIIAYSWAQYYLDYGRSDDDVTANGFYGTLKDNVITFPLEKLLVMELRDRDTELFFYQANINNKFKVVLPDLSSVEAITDNETFGPVEYFNLQGQKIANPEAGQLVIRRQGNKVSKFIAR